MFFENELFKYKLVYKNLICVFKKFLNIIKLHKVTYNFYYQIVE